MPTNRKLTRKEQMAREMNQFTKTGEYADNSSYGRQYILERPKGGLKNGSARIVDATGDTEGLRKNLSGGKYTGFKKPTAENRKELMNRNLTKKTLIKKINPKPAVKENPHERERRSINDNNYFSNALNTAVNKRKLQNQLANRQKEKK